jgi:hypothetical protein
MNSMAPPERTRLRATIRSQSLRGDVFLSREELATAAGISLARLTRLVRLGLVEQAAPGPAEFTAATAMRLRKMLRLHRDLHVNLTGAAIIVDLLERLESDLARVHGRRAG